MLDLGVLIGAAALPILGCIALLRWHLNRQSDEDEETTKLTREW